MNRFDIINRIGDKYRVGNTETGEFSYAQALKTVGKDIKDYQKATTGTQHKFLDIRFENERLVVLVECKNKFSRWDKAKIQGQLQDYVRFEKAYSDKKIVAILAETDGDEVWVWFGQSVIIDDEHRMEEETVLRTFEEYENLCFGRVNDKIKVVDSIKTLNEKLHSDGINEKLRSQFVGTCLLALKNGLVYKNVKETPDPKTGKKLAPERVVLKSIKDIDAELEVDPKTTLIVGRNNTAKTSCFVCIGNVLEGENISFNDYPLLKREDFYTKIALFMEKKLSYEDLCKQVEVISIDFLVDYSLDDPDDNLGALSPFIIDVDVDTTTALIRESID